MYFIIRHFNWKNNYLFSKIYNFENLVILMLTITYLLRTKILNEVK